MNEGAPHAPESRELSPEKAELLALEAEGKYVFHGTGIDVERLEPRQAIDTERGPDGRPGVFASNMAEYAIFMAIVNKWNCPAGARSRAGAILTDDGPPHMRFGMTHATADQLQENASGWVYVFSKDQFVPHQAERGVEFVTHEHAVPIRKIQVHKGDLPSNIEIFED